MEKDITNRNQQHYVIMTVIYDELNDFYLNGGKVFRDAREMTSEMCEVPYEEVPSFIKSTIANALQNYGTIVTEVSKYLRAWKWERLPLLTRAIFMMSYSHFYYVENVDKKVVISIAVKLAKEYIDPEQAKFINAVLDKVLNK